MQNPISPIIIRIGPTHHTYHRQVLTIRPRYRVQHAQSPDRKRHHARSHALRPRVPVGRVPGIKLIATPDIRQPRLRYQMVQKSEVEISRDGEDVADSDLHEAAPQVAAQGGLRGGDSRGGVVVLDGGDCTNRCFHC